MKTDLSVHESCLNPIVLGSGLGFVVYARPTELYSPNGSRALFPGMFSFRGWTPGNIEIYSHVDENQDPSEAEESESYAVAFDISRCLV